jgi:hypothetical protein
MRPFLSGENTKSPSKVLTGFPNSLNTLMIGTREKIYGETAAQDENGAALLDFEPPPNSTP